MVLTFQLLLDCETVTFFLCCFLSFILSLSVSIVFLDVFFASLPSRTHLSPPPFPPAPRLLQTIRSTIPRSWLTQKVRAVLWSELQITG